jgi:hypothetical protein
MDGTSIRGFHDHGESVKSDCSLGFELSGHCQSLEHTECGAVVTLW